MSYECAGGSLKLKGVSDHVIKKKKKKSKSNDLKDDLVKIMDQKKIVPEQPGSSSSSSSSFSDTTKKIHKTKAELAYEKISEKRMEEKILNKAQRSHKEHVESYNRQLDSLSEYNDIPKVSWTK